MRTESRNLYTLDELTEEARARAIESNRDWNVDNDHWCEYTLDDFRAIAQLLGFTIDQKRGVAFSGFSSQGDGASFRGRYAYRADWRAAVAEYCPQNDAIVEIGETLEALADRVFTARVAADGRDCHSGTMTAECWTGEGDDATEADCAQFLAAARSLADWLYGQLEQSYDDLRSDRQVAESLESNGVEFLADGRRP